ncbi:hypothetical protein [Microcoleus sp. FACHB-672]|uniref:hypothetical protein n=1 Tax=Microcoleus sp. FACHB-672 TaxID=2692825 RepID=UPI002814DF83|nr:hypothetical protein [Microcoleus sp. FACHB-672]
MNQTRLVCRVRESRILRLKYLPAMLVSLGRLDALIFTGNIGEHHAHLREFACEDLGFLGLKIYRKNA